MNEGGALLGQWRHDGDAVVLWRATQLAEHSRAERDQDDPYLGAQKGHQPQGADSSNKSGRSSDFTHGRDV
jgi:hypothetical protein